VNHLTDLKTFGQRFAQMTQIQEKICAICVIFDFYIYSEKQAGEKFVLE
jgi:hypothetical protein